MLIFGPIPTLGRKKKYIYQPGSTYSIETAAVRQKGVGGADMPQQTRAALNRPPCSKDFFTFRLTSQTFHL